MAYTSQALMETLQAARSKNPQSAPSIDLQCELLAAQTRASLPDLPPPPSVEAASEALAAGRSLIELANLPFDEPSVRDLAGEICDITARHRPELTDDLAAIRRRLDADSSDDEEGIDDNLFTFVLNQARRPLLHAWAERMAEAVSIGDWRQSVCPFCGGPPDMGAFKGDTGVRHLLCSQCDTEWAYSRVGCPFCGNNDPRHMAYFPSQDERYRLYVCDVCRRYLKVIDLRQAWHTAMLPVERVLTVGMDLAGRAAGYT